MNLRPILQNPWIILLRRTYERFAEDKALRLSAALAYYSIFSIAPLLVITIGIAGLVFGREAVTGQLFGELKQYLGAQSALALQSMVESASKPSNGWLATVSGLVAMFLGASAVFGQVKDALNTIWGVQAKSGLGIMGMIRGKFLNFGMVLMIGFLLLVSLIMTTAITGLNSRIESILELPVLVWALIGFVISTGMVTTLFAMIFKVLPDAQIGWRQVWIGALVTAILFEVGKTGLSWYLGREGAASAYGAAGSVVLLLLWIYYTSCILFLGAEFTQVYTESKNWSVEPSANAERVTPSERAQQGLDPSGTAIDLPAIPPALDFPDRETTPSREDVPSGVVASFLKYLEGRGMLLSIEAREALQQVISLGLWLFIAVVTIFAGWLLLATTLVGILIYWLGWSWMAATGVTAGLHLAVAGTAGFLIWKRLASVHWFSDTLAEFKKDRSWLQNWTTRK